MPVPTEPFWHTENAEQVDHYYEEFESQGFFLGKCSNARIVKPGPDFEIQAGTGHCPDCEALLP